MASAGGAGSSMTAADLNHRAMALRAKVEELAQQSMHPHSAVLGAKLPVSQVSNTEMSVYIKWSLLLQEQLSTASKQVAALRNFRAALAHDNSQLRAFADSATRSGVTPSAYCAAAVAASVPSAGASGSTVPSSLQQVPDCFGAPLGAAPAAPPPAAAAPMPAACPPAAAVPPPAAAGPPGGALVSPGQHILASSPGLLDDLLAVPTIDDSLLLTPNLERLANELEVNPQAEWCVDTRLSSSEEPKPPQP
ncbi:hypothetical protein EMIHUDRAFT_438460 [Emiliania huxleyi CCMP1516]|uniref:Uncharacterized protein n=2 Tax=Emiliania huxleyi TaxID=2903 RepID=A0A0D3I9T4_EMIH1|nr:hypothetical protein EMIHUDRAFT_438460 [Emiliania huxleyi CCMP1516]EOD08019.1 hypothetical protein EMIHUDRAFT_438460 [Emiliania huxleyi CCMP1516]|eukprot:XP_005760448.1 hypothetical protein EMIHUDRAFT_438460 [Emiliania huxleyi CCMP1516]